jgi:hypothetical protein
MPQPITAIIQRRYSCRIYQKTPLAPALRQQLTEQMPVLRQGPLGGRARFVLAAATEQDRQALKGLGTYGFIKDAPAFVLGAVDDSPKNLEDYGYLMEQIVLNATEADLGTCWLGGSFTRSNFSRKLALQKQETLPAVLSLGYSAENGSNPLRQRVGGHTRLPWSTLFFDGQFGQPLPAEAAGAYAQPLEMVRLGPSASNKQPWRIVKAGPAWHFYLQRTPGYRHNLASRLLQIVDIQRLDSGIAMCHFEMTARAAGLTGRWGMQEPALAKPDALTEYVVSWQPAA